MNILITGSNGQLGNEMRTKSAQYPQHRYWLTDIDELDITDPNALQNFVKTNAIDIIVNCAAYTNVDKAEDDEATAHLINAQAVENLAMTSAKIIHISTDYVFAGDSSIPYTETDTPMPRTAYGRTKLEGERRLLLHKPDSIILRTAWLYSSFGNNFVKTMLRLANEREQLSVVFDQIGTPTYAADLAQAVFETINAPQWQAGIYHFTNEGVCSWYDFAYEIFRLSHHTCQVQPILSSQYTYRTPRPHYSVLDKQKFSNTFHMTIPHWTDGLQRCLRQLLQPA